MTPEAFEAILLEHVHQAIAAGAFVWAGGSAAVVVSMLKGVAAAMRVECSEVYAAAALLPLLSAEAGEPACAQGMNSYVAAVKGKVDACRQRGGAVRVYLEALDSQTTDDERARSQRRADLAEKVLGLLEKCGFHRTKVSGARANPRLSTLAMHSPQRSICTTLLWLASIRLLVRCR